MRVGGVEQRIYGRTADGSNEILKKSGRLTQSERLVLIVLGAQTAADTLAAKLPSLSADRVEQALARLVELGLAYEVLIAQTQPPAEPAPLPAEAIEAFLTQQASDPITVLATPEMLERTDRIKAINASIAELLDQAGAPSSTPATQAPLEPAIPLGTLFPEGASSLKVDVMPHAHDAERVSAQLAELRRNAEIQIRALEAELHLRRAAGRTSDPSKRMKLARRVGRSSPAPASADATPFRVIAAAALAIAMVVALLAYLAH